MRYQEENNVRYFDLHVHGLHSVPIRLERNSGLCVCVLEVPGLAKSRPSVLKGDRVRGHGPLRGREDRIPPLLDYSTIFPRWVVCPCSLRDIVRRTLDYYSEFHASMLRITTQKLGRVAAVWLLSWRGSLSRSVRNVTARWHLGNTRTAAEPAEPRTKKTLRISWTVKSSDCTKQKVDTQIHFL